MLLTLYRLLMAAATPVALLWLGLQALRRPAYRSGWRQRLGYYPTPLAGRGIWLHAASVGEVQAALGLIQALLERYPQWPLLVTTVTPTGAARLRQAFGDRVQHAYLPWDSRGAVERFLDAAQPRLALIMEMEIWPNLLLGLSRRQVPRLLLNARMSARSAGRYRRVRGLFARVMEGVKVAAQTEADAQRLAALGVPAGALRVTGNLKYDIAPPAGAEAAGQAFRQSLDGRLVWIAASTHEGEDAQALSAHLRLKRRVPGLLLILVPRHPERFDRVAEACRNRGFTTARRSLGEACGPATEVYLADTMGELPLLYAAADLAFVGGSLVPVGGHNLLEPAALGLPVLSGPHLFNFRQVADLLLADQALTLVEDTDALAAAATALLTNPDERRRRGQAARAVVEANRGALERTLALIDAENRRSA